MIYIPETCHLECERLLNEALDGRREMDEALREAREKWPEHPLIPAAHAAERIEKKRFAEAEKSAWYCLSIAPCRGFHYVLLHVALAHQGRRELAECVLALGLRLLGETAVLPEGAVDFLRDRFPMKTVDHADPAVVAQFADIYEEDLLPGLDSAEISETLWPYRAIVRVVRMTDGDADRLAAAMTEQRERCLPFVRATLRDLLNFEQTFDPVVPCRFAALLGALGGPGEIMDLLEMTAADGAVNLENHAHWALYQLGQRHPAELAEAIARRTPGVQGWQWSDFAGHLLLLPAGSPVDAAVTALLDGLEREGDPFALSILLELRRALDRHGIAGELRARVDRAGAAVNAEQYRLGLKEEPRVPDLAAGVNVRATLPEILRGELYDESLEADGDDEDDGPPPARTVVNPSKPGRNDPCWCGSGKKYKKCHLDEDERKSRPGGYVM